LEFVAYASTFTKEINEKMKNILLAIAILSLMACEGRLSNEQRQKIKEDMSQHKIVRVTDAEITEEAFAQGRKVMITLDKNNKQETIDSLSTANRVKIKWLVPGATNALEIEKQLVEAYLASSINGGMDDNVQRLTTDSLLYTHPVTEKMPDGSETVKGIWGIRLSKKELILGMNK
jgi:type IV pilus biogenesis protein CpaD/CtpE